MTTANRRLLQLRMVVSLALLGIVLIGFIAGIWGVFYGLLSIVGVEKPVTAASVISVCLLGAIAALEFTQVSTVERFAGATPVDGDAEPELYRTATTVATMLDVPVPTIAISDSHAPEAMVVGYRPDAIHLVLSAGTIDALDADELEAVIAHELAHVKNRDAMVMTALSVPVVLAAGLRTRLPEPAGKGAASIVIVPLLFISNAVWVAGRTITAVLARVRERAADRAAAEVTGSPAVLATALATLDDRIEATPTRDLRAVESVSSLSILPLEADPGSRDIRLGPEGDIEPSYRWFDRLKWRLFTTHPPTEDRLETLRSLERERGLESERDRE
ncbi:M48 family metalloprotease [Natrialba asiatica]|uniref:Heat shock protein HtpX n=1 Tax=Natrialba asiatica (strain ATCC 700177 / DSM 12278 / JCM 9576 / FERM P-10747 / NBRC 102637 / 172P1) TaxID=29540 RepID=M0ALY4_NATA1|nr:M48 family metalloprotease [Natrialba asiatica]ELY98398.1 heat shock protein HtpX [Natrialba asiatica DSM 12278]